MKRIAIVGSGITGLGAAYTLSHHHHVTLFEANNYFGGHAHTVDVTLQGQTHGVDTGFLVFNHRTYPELLKLFTALKVPTAEADMGFSVKVRGSDQGSALEWCGSSLNAVFAQRRNLLKPRFFRMLSQILRFNKETTAAAINNHLPEMTLGEYLKTGGYSDELRDWYLLPMAACVWSCPPDAMLAYPAVTFIQFCYNHGLLQGFEGRPQWYTVKGGSREYVKRIIAKMTDKRLKTPVLGVHRGEGKLPLVETVHTTESFDAVLLATHSDTALQLLKQATSAETSILSRLRYQKNLAVLHTDASVLPTARRAWAAWNYESAGKNLNNTSVCCHYLINRLQPLPFELPVIVSLNPIREPEHIIQSFEYAHPVFDAAAILAQKELQSIQGKDNVWFAGAWAGYGFHEDGLKAGLLAAQQIEKRFKRYGEDPIWITGKAAS
ncbi:MAG: FAD-dependent oxidoreductase [Burkholderiaceae bacterium]|nr:FAD-dependent oxidoreductase [Burkholderiaceae bacterium]